MPIILENDHKHFVCGGPQTDPFTEIRQERFHLLRWNMNCRK